MAATLELRGYSLGVPHGRRRREPSRYDARFYAVAAAVLAAAIVGKIAGADDFHPYPTIHIGLGAPTLVVCAVVLASGLAPWRRAARGPAATGTRGAPRGPAEAMLGDAARPAAREVNRV